MGMNALEVRRRVMMAQPHEAVATGAIASFRTDVVSPLPMEFDLVPIQDLHGQDAPYPPGGGVNKWDEVWASSLTIGSYGNNFGSVNFVPVIPGETYYFVTGSYSINSRGLRLAYYDANKELTSSTVTYRPSVTIPSGCYFIKFGIQQNVYGTTYLNDISINYPSTDTAYHPYSNICPITGHDGFTRHRTGKNLFDGEVHNLAFVAQSTTAADIQGNSYWRSIYARVEGGKTYTISRTTIETNRFRMVATVDEPTVGEDAVILSNSADNDSLYAVTVTIPDGYNYLFVYLSNQGATVTPGNYQIELGSHATTIVPYQGNSYSTTFPTPPGTVYGGHVTDNGDGTGTLTVNYINYPLTTPFRVGENGKYAQYSLANIASGYTLATNPFLCNRYKPSNYSALYDNHVHFANASLLAVMLSDKIGTTPTAWRDYFIDNPTYVCYKLATPQTYTLPLEVIKSLIGQNHVWVDNADEVSVEYWGH